uniref:FMN-linked oxidoreductases superfamily protein n=1 Tax=Tanacetum cinerariifolium TaxID=118510 RepID=A0A6L2JNV0_TANCI|nr:FMN-linked oxidoreductases superfamily protein [Tanacetum cinerariifolium]
MIKLRNWKHILSNCRQCNQSPDGDHTTTSSNTSSRPEVGGSVKPLYGLFWGETGNGVWKRNADSAFHHCKTFKDVMEETISAMANRVLDAPVVDAYSTQAHI